ncbi:MAG: TM2 domain-containing protein [Flavobacteriales bacterium]
MKKTLLLLITFISLSQLTYASFPVTEEMNNSKELILNNTQMESGPDMDWTAFNLCLFGGYLGLHRFYMGHNGIAVLQLMTGGGLGIWWIIDLIKIVNGSLYKGPLNPQFPDIDFSMLTICLFGGLFGLHRFYKGDKKIAQWQLFTLGGLGIWWLIDLVKILTGKLYKQ